MNTVMEFEFHKVSLDRLSDCQFPEKDYIPCNYLFDNSFGQVNNKRKGIPRIGFSLEISNQVKFGSNRPRSTFVLHAGRRRNSQNRTKSTFYHSWVV
jgi:hypothetical protein